MSDIQNAINDINKNYNFPALPKLIKLVQSKHPFSKDEIIKAVKTDVNTQLMTQKKTPKSLGHITSLAVNETMELDIFDMQKYKNNNIVNKTTYPYMLVLIDVFSRAVYIEPLENKLAETVLETFEKLIHKVKSKQLPNKVLKEKTKNYVIHQIISDNEGSFQSNIMEKYLDDNNILLTMNAHKDHRVLGIIDVFARNLKIILTKTFLFNKSTRWVDIIDNIVNIYNNTPHTALDGLTPNQAMMPENFNKVVKLNINKMEDNKRTTSLSIGDKVRKYMLFRKEISKASMNPQWSDKIFRVVQVDGQTITLDDNTKHKRYNLLKVPDDTPETEPNIISKNK